MPERRGRKTVVQKKESCWGDEEKYTVYGQFTRMKDEVWREWKKQRAGEEKELD